MVMHYFQEHGDHLSSSFEQFSSGPTIKFHLRWAREPVTKLVDRPRPVNLAADDTLDSNSNKENDRPGQFFAEVLSITIYESAEHFVAALFLYFYFSE